jgi:hypothetical protein
MVINMGHFTHVGFVAQFKFVDFVNEILWICGKIGLRSGLYHGHGERKKSLDERMDAQTHTFSNTWKEGLILKDGLPYGM